MSIHSTQIGLLFLAMSVAVLSGTRRSGRGTLIAVVFLSMVQRPSGFRRPKTKARSVAKQAAGVFLSSLQDADANKENAFIKSIESGNYIIHTKTWSGVYVNGNPWTECCKSGQKTSWDGNYTGKRKDRSEVEPRAV